MRNRLLLLGSLLGVGILLVVSPPTSAHGGQAQEQARPVPRQPDGKPDLSGIWARSGSVNRYFTSSDSGVSTAEEAMRPEARESTGISSPPQRSARLSATCMTPTSNPALRSASPA